MAILDGKALAASLRESLKGEVARFTSLAGRPPALHVVLVGDDPASQVYVRNKKKACEAAGLTSREHRLPATTPQGELEDLVRDLGADDAVDGILVQLPLPRHLDAERVLDLIVPDKDVDGFHPVSLGRLITDRPGLVPCTPQGCLRLIDHAGIDLQGRNAVVIGRSTIVGKPMALLLLRRHATVTLCHSRTRDLPAVVRAADLVIAAVGRPELVRGDWIQEGATVIDVGINRLDDGRLVGDVAYGEVAPRAAWITPVPGGVGPMTIACLLANTVEAAFARRTRRD